MNVSRRRYMGEKGGSSPYQRIEYLQSNGTHRIDTGIVFDFANKYEIIYEVVFTTKNPGRQYNGWDAGGASGILQSGKISDGDSTTGFGIDILNESALFDVVINAGSSTQTVTKVTVNNTDYTNSRAHSSLATYAGSSGYCFFTCASRGSYNYYCYEKIYSAKIYKNDILVRDFIPVRIEQVGYLYDTISGELFGNAGTGNFVLGPDVND